MTIGAEEQSSSSQGVRTTNLKSELRRILAEEFEKRLTESGLISEEQCKRLCNLLMDESISAPDIIKTLTGHGESTADD